MTLNRENSIRIISDGIAWLATLCELRGAIHLFDSHTISHEFYCRLLNEIYDLNLKVLDRIEANYPAIDLGDQINKKSFQISAEKGSDKIQTTLNKFKKYNLEEKYSKLQFLIIGKKQESYKSVVVPTGLTFLPEDDILDTKGLLKTIESLGTEKLALIAKIVETEITTTDLPSELFLHICAYNEQPTRPFSDYIRLTYLTKKEGEQITIQPFMPYLETLSAGGPIQPLRYITPTWCPFDWNFPALDLKLMNRTLAPFLLAEAICEVEESHLDPTPVIVIKEDIQQSFAGAFWLVNEGSSSLNDVIVKYDLIPGNILLSSNFPETYPFHYDLGTLDNQAEIRVDDAFGERGVDLKRLSILENVVDSDIQSKSVKVMDENGVESVMTWDDHQKAIKQTLGPFQEEVGTVIGKINFMESYTGLNYTICFRAMVYIFNKNRRSILKPPSAFYNVKLETIGTNYKRLQT